MQVLPPPPRGYNASAAAAGQDPCPPNQCAWVDGSFADYATDSLSVAVSQASKQASKEGRKEGRPHSHLQ
jgi:hypothetical protein